MSADIFCIECGARPFPELGPPGTRQDFDLVKIGGVAVLPASRRQDQDEGQAGV
jgi:hypothetical protein